MAALPGPSQRLISFNGVKILEDFIIIHQDGCQWQVTQAVAYTNEEYLRSVPIPQRNRKGGVAWRDPITNKSYRFFFRLHLALLLGWQQRRGEGDDHGYVARLNALIRMLWPEPIASVSLSH